MFVVNCHSREFIESLCSYLSSNLLTCFQNVQNDTRPESLYLLVVSLFQRLWPAGQKARTSNSRRRCYSRMGRTFTKAILTSTKRWHTICSQNCTARRDKSKLWWRMQLAEWKKCPAWGRIGGCGAQQGASNFQHLFQSSKNVIYATYCHCKICC